MNLNVEITGIITIGAIEITALATNTDGAFLIPVVTAIAIICGYELKKIELYVEKKKTEKLAGPQTIYDLIHDRKT